MGRFRATTTPACRCTYFYNHNESSPECLNASVCLCDSMCEVQTYSPTDTEMLGLGAMGGLLPAGTMAPLVGDRAPVAGGTEIELSVCRFRKPDSCIINNTPDDRPQNQICRRTQRDTQKWMKWLTVSHHYVHQMFVNWRVPKTEQQWHGGKEFSELCEERQIGKCEVELKQNIGKWLSEDTRIVRDKYRTPACC